MSQYSTDEPPAEHHDRSLGLVLFGIVEILIGAACALLIPLVVVSVVVTSALGGPGASPDMAGTVPTLILYAVLAVMFIWIGVGSIRARRWARALMLVVSWLWLITGVAAMIVSWWVLPEVWRTVGLSSGLPREGLMMVMVTTSLFVGFIYVALPAAFLLFYRSPHVAATCQARDPGPSRIADCPPHILSLVVLFVLAAVSVLMMPFFDFLLPLFGVVLTGGPGAVGWAAILLLLLYLAWGSYRGDLRAWWVAVVTTLFAACASIVTAAIVPLPELLAAMDLGGYERALIEQLWSPRPAALAALSLVVWGSFIAYLLYVRRFFEGQGGGDPTP
jgi:hypothetical protein